MGDMLAVLGDFNICKHASWQVLPEGATEYEALGTALRSSCQAEDLFGGGGHEPTMRQEPNKLSFAPDHVFATRRLRELVARTSIEDSRSRDKSSVISDHFGLIVDLQLRQE